LVAVRFPKELTASVDHWAAQRKLSRSEAIRILVEQALEMFNQANRGKRK
jgi:metal-responsive CopG/Arc/MetJ family transcriptional regulator